MSKYKNSFVSYPRKPIYSQVRVDGLVQSKFKCCDQWIAIPDDRQKGIGLIPYINEADYKSTIKYEYSMYTLVHSKPIQEYEISPDSKFLSSSTRSDILIRIWKLPVHSGYDPNIRSEMDSPEIFLAGHEKKIDILKFHPTCKSIVLSGSMDSTIKLWDLVGCQELISLEMPNQTTPVAVDITAQGSFVVAAGSDGLFHLYDPRSSTFPIKSWLSSHNIGKSIRVAAVPHWDNNYIISTGFGNQNEREIKVYDVRNFQSHMDKAVTVQSGAAPMIPICDPLLPVVYFCMKGEGIRIYDIDNGTLNFQNAPKVEKQFLDSQILPKSYCDKTKVEIARFLYLGNDKSLDFQSVCIPRKLDANNDDLYPPSIKLNSDITAEDWLKGDTDIEIRSVTTIKPVLSVKDKIVKQLQTFKESKIRLKNQTQSIECTLLLKGDTLYLGDSNTFELKYIDRMQNIEDYKIKKTEFVEVEIKFSTKIFIFQLREIEEYDEWVNLLQSYTESYNLPKLPPLKTHALLLETFTVHKPSLSKGEPYLVTLCENNSLNFYAPNIKLYLAGDNPKFTLNLNRLDNIAISSFNCISIFFENSVFHIVHSKEKCVELWYNQVVGGLNVKNIAKVMKNGLANVNINGIHYKNAWIAIFENTIIYADQQLSTTVLFKVLGEKFEDTKMKVEQKQHTIEYKYNGVKMIHAFNSGFEIREINSSKTPNFAAPLLITVISNGSNYLAYCVDSNSSVNPKSCLVGDMAEKIYFWFGKQSSKLCQAEAVSIGSTIRKDRGCKPTLIFTDHDEKLLNDFSIAAGINFQSMKESDCQKENMICVYKIRADTDLTKYNLFQRVYEGPITSKTILEGCCIVHFQHEVFYWYQNGASVTEKNLILTGARCLSSVLVKSNPMVMLSEEFEGRESALFKKKFVDYILELPINMKMEEAAGNIAKGVIQSKISFAELIQKKQVESKRNQNFKTKSLEFYLIKNFARIPIELEKNGGIDIVQSAFSIILLVVPNYYAIWKGKLTGAVENTALQSILKLANIQGKKEIPFSEADLAKGSNLLQNNYKNNPRLFVFSDATGVVTASEVFNLLQEDLEKSVVGVLQIEEDIAVAFYTIFPWLVRHKIPNRQEIKAIFVRRV
ncbi:hypothetical protein HDV01_005279 [Terramyces sp. JEL0728]|nr:hypothetical protein HDV01_005279 [Terramyces sp. JEL0728]